MFHARKCVRFFVWQVALIVIFFLASLASAGDTLPFKVTGRGLAEYIPITVNEPVIHFAIGQATGLGRYYGEGKVQLDEFTSPSTANFSSTVPFVFVGANGDKLAFTYGQIENNAAGPGKVQLTPTDDGLFVAVWVAEFNPVPELCTGRFTQVVAGSFVMTAITEPFVLGATDPVAYRWFGKGSLEFAKGQP